jgi:hypothetical protein
MTSDVEWSLNLAVSMDDNVERMRKTIARVFGIKESDMKDSDKLLMSAAHRSTIALKNARFNMDEISRVLGNKIARDMDRSTLQDLRNADVENRLAELADES